jgi:tRNA(Leu) C34 or U34 (ribose-2'-O)-methylase TrmL
VFKSIVASSGPEDISRSRAILTDLLQFNTTTKERYKELRELFPKFKELENAKLLESVYLDGYFVRMMRKAVQKDKVIVIIFGNETRGASERAKSISNYRLTIPHFGYSDISYNLSVSCGMILFYLYEINILPGCFLQFPIEKGVELLAQKMLTNFKKITREEILKLELNDVLNDL